MNSDSELRIRSAVSAFADPNDLVARLIAQPVWVLEPAVGTAAAQRLRSGRRLVCDLVKGAVWLADQDS